MQKLNLITLESIIRMCWAKETTSDQIGWTPDNPSLGQCAVTALVVQDYLGGEIVWAPATLPDREEISHYFNKINGKEIDLTRHQFPAGTNIPKGTTRTKEYPTTRDFILSYLTTKRRYELLKQRVQEHF